MSFISHPINGQKTAEDVLVILILNGVVCKHIPQNDSFVLEHNKTKEEFHELIVNLCEFLGLKAQDERWFPGSPTNEYTDCESDISDYVYYVCPIKVQDNDDDLTNYDYDFDMMISMYEVTWC
jgi:hypothetical protein